jgi:hypothetical protein
MNYQVISYLIYLIVTLILTLLVGYALFKNGKIFLYDIFHGNEALANAVNRLLLVGFYLINFGYSVYSMMITPFITDNAMMMELLSQKVGRIILILGAMHFLNMFIFFRLRSHANRSVYERPA